MKGSLDKKGCSEGERPLNRGIKESGSLKNKSQIVKTLSKSSWRMNQKLENGKQHCGQLEGNVTYSWVRNAIVLHVNKDSTNLE